MGKDSEFLREDILSTGQLRFVCGYGIALRVHAIDDGRARVERLPGGAMLHLPITKELLSQPIASEDGLYMRWLRGHGELNGAPASTLLEWIWCDEQAAGHNYLRLRALEPYLTLMGADTLRREELRRALSTGAEWVRVGRGAEGGFRPRGSDHDWRTKWSNAGIPIPNTHSEADERSTLALLEATITQELNTTDRETKPSLIQTGHIPPPSHPSDYHPLPHGDRDAQRLDEQSDWAMAVVTESALASIATTQCLPTKLQIIARDILVSRWKSKRDRHTFRRLTSRALTLIFQALDTTELFDALVEPQLGIGSRREVLRLLRLKQGSPLSTYQSRPISSALVASQIFSLATERPFRSWALRSLLRTPCPTDAEDSTDVLRLARQGLITDQALDLSLFIEAAYDALEAGVSPRQIEGWAVCLDDEHHIPSPSTLLEALGTHAALVRSKNSLSPFSMSPSQVSARLDEWLRRESLVDEENTEEGEQADQPPDPLTRLRRFAMKIPREDLRVQIIEQLNALGEHLSAERDKRLYAEALSKSVDNAKIVYQRDQARLTREERDRLMRSAESEVAEARRRERVAVAKVVGEVITALVRAESAADLKMISQTQERVIELAQDLGLSVAAHIGTVVSYDPTQHEARFSPGEMGRVIAVGITDQNNSVLVRARLVLHIGE